MCNAKNNDKLNFVLLVQEFERQFKKENESYLISAIIPPIQDYFQKGTCNNDYWHGNIIHPAWKSNIFSEIDIFALSEALDWMLLITNDFPAFEPH